MPASRIRLAALLAAGLGAAMPACLAPAHAAGSATSGLPPITAEAKQKLDRGENPWPVALQRPKAAPLSAMAALGKLVFNDASLSSSGRQSCASCHDPAHDFGPIGAAAVVNGGPKLATPGLRAVPSLMYLDQQPAFSVGPDNEEDETATLADKIAASQGVTRAKKTAATTADSATALVPQGGLFWDGRADSLQQQAIVPLLNPVEMDGGSVGKVAGKLRHAAYAARFVQLFGPAILDKPDLLVDEAMFALARYQIEDIAFHPYTSKFDSWLEGRARFTPSEMRGYLLYNDTEKADCGGCHVDQVTADGAPPVFTDHQYEALGVPRNDKILANADQSYFDQGVCGPIRPDMTDQHDYCAMFTTPTLRNTARRHVFFHNGLYTTLQQVMDFYAFRDTDPARIYPKGKDGQVAKYNDMPPSSVTNVDVTDPPFDRHPGDEPAMNDQDRADIIAFLGTLNDGYTH